MILKINLYQSPLIEINSFLWFLKFPFSATCAKAAAHEAECALTATRGTPLTMPRFFIVVIVIIFIVIILTTRFQMFLIIVNFYFQLLLAQTLSNLRGRHHPSMSSPETGSIPSSSSLDHLFIFIFQALNFPRLLGQNGKSWRSSSLTRRLERRMAGPTII